MMDTESATTVLLWFQHKGPAAGGSIQFQLDTAKSGRQVFVASMPESREGALAREFATFSVLSQVRQSYAEFLRTFDVDEGESLSEAEANARADILAALASVEAAIQASSRVLVAAVQGRCSGFPIQ